MNRKDIVIWTLVAVVLLCSFVGGGVMLGIHRFDSPGPLTATRDVMIPRGPQSEVAAVLVESGVIANAHEFQIAAALTRGQGNILSAEFAFPSGASLRQVLTILRTGKPVYHQLTIPEGLTATQIQRLIQRAPSLAGDIPTPPEGALLPQTYAYDYAATRTSLVDRATAAMTRTLADVWAHRAPDLALKTPQELVILASIVERETARPEERPHVAAVFLNRLKQGMRLQSDPTVAYAVTNGLSAADRALTRADLDVASPYNTYRNTGLPPTPIDSPGIAAMQAVAQPMNSDDLYFVADGSGGHAFAKTLDEHNRNVAKWRALTTPPTGGAPVATAPGAAPPAPAPALSH